ncbi:hypothetical protein PQX77_009916 [Marasmius sp. AFHP31]|nr:hypothetical protein PQX77_009916 [Marasmius sp. AFHP31]
MDDSPPPPPPEESTPPPPPQTHTGSPTDFLKGVVGKRVIVRLNSGVDYRGILSCLDGYMNIAMEQTEEHVNGKVTNRYGDAFIRGNNGMSSGGIALSEMVLTTRVWAIWGRGRIFGTLLMLFFLGCWAPSILFQYKLIQSVVFAQSMPMVNERGCLVKYAKPYAGICFGLLMVYEGGLLLLMIFSCLNSCMKNATKGKLAKIVYTDGLSLINLVVVLRFPGSALVDLLGSFERVMYPILTSRVIFHIRAHTSASASGRGSVGRHCAIPASSTSALHTLQLQEGDMVQHDVYEDGIGIAL